MLRYQGRVVTVLEHATGNRDSPRFSAGRFLRMHRRAAATCQREVRRGCLPSPTTGSSTRFAAGQGGMR